MGKWGVITIADMKNKWLKRQILSYVPLFFIVVLLLIMVFFLMLNEITKKNALKANEYSLRTIVQNVDQALNEIDQRIMNEIIGNRAIGDYFKDIKESNPYLVTFEASKKIRELSFSEPLIDSIYLYRFIDNSILGPNSMTTINNFEDRSFISAVLDEKNKLNRWSGIRLYKEFKNSESKEVVSLVKTYPLLSGSEGIIVINVSANSIQRAINSMFNNKLNYVEVFDINMKKSFGIGEDQGERSKNFTGEYHKEIISSKSSYTGWEYRSRIKYANLYDILTFVSISWISLGILLIILGGVWILFFTYRSYKPIQALVNNISALKEIDNFEIGTEGANEFKIIENAIDKLVNISLKYQNRFKEDVLYRQKHFFTTLLNDSGFMTQESWKMEMGQIRISDEFVKIGIFIVEIDDYYVLCKRFTEHEQALFKSTLKNMTSENYEKQDVSVWSEWISQNMLCALCFIKVDIEDADDRILGLCDNIIEKARNGLPFSVTIGMGDCTEKINDISEIYKSALKALDCKVVLGGDQIIPYWKIWEKYGGEVQYFLQNISSFTKSFRMAEPEWDLKLDDIFIAFKESRLTREELVTLGNYMIYSLYKEIMCLPSEYQELWKNEAHSAFCSILQRSETIQEIHECFSITLKRIAERMALMRENSSRYNTIVDVKDYIDKNFMNASLSIDELSDKYKLHSTYISRLFKEKYGIKLIDYIISLRMNEAKKYLVDTQMSVEQVASEIGYTHSISFIRAFKKIVGTTPGDYRKERGN